MKTLVTINTYSLLVLKHDVISHTNNAHYGTTDKADFKYLNDLTSAIHEASIHLDTATYHSKATVHVTERTLRFLLEEAKDMFEHSVWDIKFDDLEALEKTRDLTQAILHAMEALEALDAKDEPEATLKEVA
tara:strand:+ start:195 stop:590 length:396 start_codon:yes stop_codon:yes gene_type:complete